MLRDMTEWERHEAALRQEKEKTEHYINVAGVLFVVLDANGNVVTVNRKTCEVLGRESDELVGRDWFSTALPKDIQDQVRQTFDHLMAGRLEPYEYIEAPVLTASGETRLVSWHNALLKDEKGAVFGTVSSGDDITERKEMERLLAESEERYRVLFERSSEAVLIARPNGEIITANSATARLFGVGPEDPDFSQRYRILSEPRRSHRVPSRGRGERVCKELSCGNETKGRHREALRAQFVSVEGSRGQYHWVSEHASRCHGTSETRRPASPGPEAGIRRYPCRGDLLMILTTFLQLSRGIQKWCLPTSRKTTPTIMISQQSIVLPSGAQNLSNN